MQIEISIAVSTKNDKGLSENIYCERVLKLREFSSDIIVCF